jgi:hypothetical protein
MSSAARLAKQRISRCKGEQACEKCSLEAEDDDIRPNAIEKITVAITHFLVEMASWPDLEVK